MVTSRPDSLRLTFKWAGRYPPPLALVELSRLLLLILGCYRAVAESIPTAGLEPVETNVKSKTIVV
jgi:hypothetical protein